jgi:DNA (cytosine-5)-methyltransferase 1
VSAYYNEHDPRAAAWLRELVAAGLIAAGDVDERSITDVRATDLVGYRQVHLFAGIGGWSYAARLAGIPDDFPFWSGSCPCQPFSSAGKGRGVDDERHLWPVMRDLVTQRAPSIVVGEQVASAAGRGWLAAVRSDLESLGYAVGAADLCAAGVGAPHIRQRLYWGGVRVADPDGGGLRQGPGRAGCPAGRREPDRRCGLVDSDGAGRSEGRRHPSGRFAQDGGRTADIGSDASQANDWLDHGWVQCSDGRARPIAPVARRVDDGVPVRVGLLRGYGNAIVPKAAAIFLIGLLGNR